MRRKGRSPVELFSITDPDVTLTDYGLAVLCGVMAFRIWRGPRFGPTRAWLLAFFIAAGLAPLLGGTVHGFFEVEGTAGHEALWVATLLAIGAAAVSAWGLGARLILRDGLARGLIGLAALAFVIYSAAVLGGSRTFRVAVLHYLPAALFLLVTVLIAFRRSGHRGFLLGALGLVLTFGAAAVQQLGIGVHAVWFDHNALYHVVQAVALILFYRGMTAALALDSVRSRSIIGR